MIFTSSQADFEGSTVIARKVLPFLGAHKIPATPENYMIFFLYFEGEHRVVKEMVDQRLGQAEPWGPEDSKTIFEHVFDPEFNLAMFRMSGKLAREVRDTANEIISEADSAAQLAGNSGKKLNDTINTVRQIREMKDVVMWLRQALEEVNLINHASGQLSGRLKAKSHSLGQVVRTLSSMEAMALTDELTGLANRRAWDNRLALEFSHYQRYKRPCSVIMVDLDDFKRVNDKFGHLVGDTVLKRLAAIMQETLRDVDLPARFGGEEFTCLLRETGAEEANLVAERLRTAVEMESFSTKSGTFKVTASFGVSSFSEDDKDSSSIVQRADEALYRAKDQGKNRVCC